MVLLLELKREIDASVQLFTAMWSIFEYVTPKKRTPPTAQEATAGSSEIQFGCMLGPLALSCQPVTRILLLFSTSIDPIACLLMVPAPDVRMPGPFGFAPPPSKVTKLEDSTAIPTPDDWIDVCAPLTTATMPCEPLGLMFRSTMPRPALPPLPAIVRFKSTNDLVRRAP